MDFDKYISLTENIEYLINIQIFFALFTFLLFCKIAIDTDAIKHFFENKSNKKPTRHSIIDLITLGLICIVLMMFGDIVINYLK